MLVVGGGITGAGVALDAASRGLRTALVEKADFASGTSSKSSKMVHGGIRYLQQREFRLVYENLAERQRLLHNAPHLVTPLPVPHPAVRAGRRGVQDRGPLLRHRPLALRPDRRGRASGSGTGGSSRRRRWPTSRRSHRPAGRRLPLLRRPGRRRPPHALLAPDRGARLRGGGGQLRARRRPGAGRGRHGARGAGEPGGAARCAGSFGEVDGGPDFDVRATVVVNATGVWADERPRPRRAGRPPRHPAGQGRARHGAGGPSALRHRRRASRCPPTAGRSSSCPGRRRASSTSGTTDTDYDGPLDEPALHARRRRLPARRGQRRHHRGPHPRGRDRGVGRSPPAPRPSRPRPRVAERTADLSRRHTVRTSPDGVVTVTGGKLTTYRKMAEDAVAAVTPRLPAGRAAGRCVTKGLRLRGAPGPGSPTGLPRSPEGSQGAVLTHLRARYGTEVGAVLSLADGRPELLEPLVEGLPYLGVEVVYAARSEMARVPGRRPLPPDPGPAARRPTAAEAAAAAGRLMAPELGWTEVRGGRAGGAILPGGARRPGAAGVATGGPDQGGPGQDGPGRTGRSQTTQRAPAGDRSDLPRRGGGGARRRHRAARGMRVTVPDEVLARIAAGGAEVASDPGAGSGRARLVAGRHRLGRPRARSRPGRRRWSARPTSSQVAAVLAACSTARRPGHPGGGRSGVCGGAVPVFGGVALDCTGLRRAR